MALLPSEQWWTINGQVMLDAMWRCHNGQNPEIIYLELIANSETIDMGDE